MPNGRPATSTLAQALGPQDEARLFEAARTNDCAMLERMAARAWPPGLADSNGDTPLHMAAANGHVHATLLLLPSCDALAANAQGASALRLAAMAGSEHCVEILLAPSDPAALDHEGMSALQWCVQNEEWGCAELLLERPPGSIALRACLADAMGWAEPRVVDMLMMAFEAQSIREAAGPAPAQRSPAPRL